MQAAPDARPAAVHLTFIPYPESPVLFSDDSRAAITASPWEKSGVTRLSHHTWQLALPAAAQIKWPVLPHNPYTSDGHADYTEGRLVVTLPLALVGQTLALELTVPSPT